MAIRKSSTTEYNSWIGMKQRCENPRNPKFRHYGGRGIVVCERWRESFDTFLADMGLRPSAKHSLDRFPDNNGPYAPDNCRWATLSQQRLNTRQKSHCIRGHALTPDNLKHVKTGWRRCLTCAKRSSRAAYRRRVGPKQPTAKLTSAQVIEMRSRHAAGEKTRQFFREYGISYTTAKDTISRHRWKHL